MLYYPHYTPSRQQLRSLLLFSDTVSLIVPAIDQGGVRRRGHVSEILDSDGSLIDFKDPTFHYSDWMKRGGVAQATEKLISELVEKADKEGVLNSIEFDNNGYVKSGQSAKIEERISKNGWKYIAEEKFPRHFEDLFFKDGMALRAGIYRNPVTNEIVEHNGVLCHPKLADFVLSRMAREVAFVNGIPSITFGGINYTNHLYDPDQPVRADRTQLLQSVMDLVVPDNIEKYNVHDFLRIREEYKVIRREIWRYLEDISRESNLDIKFSDQSSLINRLTATRESIKNDMEAIRRQIGRERFKSEALFALESSATIAFVALAASLGGPLAAAGTMALSIAVSRGVKMMSTLGEKSDGTAKSVVMSIAKIERRGIPTRRALPSYLTNF